MAWGQNPSLEFKAAYVQAKTEFKNKNYSVAKGQFEKLSTSFATNSYSQYLTYFIGLANFRLNNYNGAENELVKIQNAFPKKENNLEAAYLLGLTYLRKNEVELAIPIFAKIENTSFAKEIDHDIKTYFASISEVKYLNDLKAKFPGFKTLNSISIKPNTESVYNLSKNQIPFLQKKQPKNFNKGYFNVALLLPFNIDSAKNNQSVNNQYVIDFYEGAHFANEKLKAENINLKFHAYNIGNSQAEMVKLLNNQYFLAEDLLIGPLHQEANKIAQYYANNQNVAIINPLSGKKQLTDNKPFSYLAKASLAGFARQAIKYASYSYTGEFALVYDEKDSASVRYFSQEFAKNKIKYTLIKYQNPNSFKSINKQFAGIFIGGHTQNATAIINAIDTKFGQVPIMADRSIFPDKLQFSTNIKPDLYLFNQEFIDENEAKIQDFKTNYWNSKNNLTSYYTYLGYDLTLFWGRHLAKYKENYLEMLAVTSETEGYLLSGFNYKTMPNENTAYTITTIENGVEVFFRKF
jgi:hypothetical protein